MLYFNLIIVTVTYCKKCIIGNKHYHYHYQQIIKFSVAKLISWWYIYMEHIVIVLLRDSTTATACKLVLREICRCGIDFLTRMDTPPHARPSTHSEWT